MPGILLVRNYFIIFHANGTKLCAKLCNKEAHNGWNMEFQGLDIWKRISHSSSHPNTIGCRWKSFVCTLYVDFPFEIVMSARSNALSFCSQFPLPSPQSNWILCQAISIPRNSNANETAHHALCCRKLSKTPTQFGNIRNIFRKEQQLKLFGNWRCYWTKVHSHHNVSFYAPSTCDPVIKMLCTICTLWKAYKWQQLHRNGKR